MIAFSPPPAGTTVGAGVAATVRNDRRSELQRAGRSLIE
jgi:hypothetical protein